ncbi:MAG: DUF3179 domain-containing protein [Acidimicrobiia bacterium]|nr:DUF3179 domain-containing protein [Acidimicrobiia bacterium]MYG60052.1 DUF3179 domain-containing protein [Acidimicrobiia bacterium]MYJ32220.1 DUF3179 domain-containing protein [Acidimicrobiia bacterium]
MHVRLGALLVGAAALAAACAGADNAGPDPASLPTAAVMPGEDSAQSTATADAAADAPTTPAPSPTAAVVLDPRETGGLRNFLGYQFPSAPQVPTGPLSPAATDQLDSIWSKLRTGGLGGAEVSRLAESGDARLAWILSDLMRFVRPGGDISTGAISAFESLTGAALNDDPVALRSPWQSVTDHLIAWDLPVFGGYADYKGRLFTLIEPGWQPFFEDADADIDWRLVSWGGVLIDDREFGDPRPCPQGCIPALDDPGVTDAEGGSWYPDDGIVFAVVIGDEARAYPRHIMEIHEMVNDSLGERRIGMPYCTLCGSAQAYFTDDVPDGVEMPVLRTSGLLSRSNKVMYDLVTNSVFDTFTGRAVSGPLRQREIVLPQATVVTTTWGDWKAAHPHTTIVAQGGGIGRVYPFNPLGGRDDRGPIFPVGDVDERLSVQDQVFGVVLDDGTPVAFPVEAAIAALRGGEVVELSGVELRLDGGGVRAIDVNGDEIVGHQAFWFAWSQFMADTLLWEP